jgi:uncharacterized protein YaaQ
MGGDKYVKLIITVIQDRDANDLLSALTEDGHRATKLASTGGFLRGGNTTLMIGVEEPAVEGVLGIIRRTCKAREQLVASLSPAAATGEAFIPFPTEVMVGGAIVFVVDIERFEKW